MSLCSLLIAANANAAATWSLTLSNPDQVGSPGSTLTYSGTIGNLTGTDILLDTGKINFVTALTSTNYVKNFADDFLATLGDIPAAGYTGALFFVTWNASAPAGGSGAGSLVLTAESPASPSSLASSFTAAVSGSPTISPEPSTPGLLISAGLILLTGSAWKRLTKVLKKKAWR